MWLCRNIHGVDFQFLEELHRNLYEPAYTGAAAISPSIAKSWERSCGPLVCEGQSTAWLQQGHHHQAAAWRPREGLEKTPHPGVCWEAALITPVLSFQDVSLTCSHRPTQRGAHGLPWAVILHSCNPSSEVTFSKLHVILAGAIQTLHNLCFFRDGVQNWS